MRYFFLSVLAWFLVACAESSVETTVGADQNIPLKEIKQWLRDSGEVITRGDVLLGRTSVIVDWIEFEGGKKNVAERLNSAIRKKLHGSICSAYRFEDACVPSDQPDDLKQMVSGFVKAFKQSELEYGEAIPWELRAYVYKEYHSPYLLSLHYNLETYTGGAHGNNSNFLWSFDATTGEELNALQFFADTTALKNLLTQKYREEQHLRPNQPLSDAGLYEQFNLSLPIPANLGFNAAGLVAIYNPYEIAPYAQGTIVITLQDEQILPILKGGKRP